MEICGTLRGSMTEASLRFGKTEGSIAGGGFVYGPFRLSQRPPPAPPTVALAAGRLTGK